MNSEMNTSEASGSGAMANLDGANLGGVDLNQVTLGHLNLEDEEVLAMRHSLHELANVFTGVMIAGDLLDAAPGRWPS